MFGESGYEDEDASLRNPFKDEPEEETTSFGKSGYEDEDASQRRFDPSTDPKEGEYSGYKPRREQIFKGRHPLSDYFDDVFNKHHG